MRSVLVRPSHLDFGRQDFRGFRNEASQLSARSLGAGRSRVICFRLKTGEARLFWSSEDRIVRPNSQSLRLADLQGVLLMCSEGGGIAATGLKKDWLLDEVTSLCVTCEPINSSSVSSCFVDLLSTGSEVVRSASHHWRCAGEAFLRGRAYGTFFRVSEPKALGFTDAVESRSSLGKYRSPRRPPLFLRTSSEHVHFSQVP